MRAKTRRRRWIINLLALSILGAVWIGCGVVLVGSSQGSGSQMGSDFSIFYDSAVQLRRGLPIYAPPPVLPGGDGNQYAFSNLNPPALSVVMLPLTRLSRHHAYSL